MKEIKNGIAFPIGECPRTGIDEFRREILGAISRGGRLSALFGRSLNAAAAAPYLLTAVVSFSEGETVGLRITSAEVSGPDARYPSLTPDCPQAHLFEREIAESIGLVPEGHPWLKPVRYPPSAGTTAVCGTGDFLAVDGAGVHEVAVGPVHAGVIEPGHFRFQCHGEEVLHLEIALGYQHRGIERAFLENPGPRRLHYAETLAGDTTVGHALAWCQAAEALGLVSGLPRRADAVRLMALELERLANHTGDLGALAGDVGFLPTHSYCGRLRGEFLNLTAELCGNRFGRGLIVPGGVAWDLEDEVRGTLLQKLRSLRRDLRDAVELLWFTPTVVSRFEGVGVLSPGTARDLGLVGVAARASGIAADVRRDNPSGELLHRKVPLAVEDEGDVNARAKVRWQEIQISMDVVETLLEDLPGDGARIALPPWQPLTMVVSLAEGWRGEICHVLATDDAGSLASVKVVDPSFHNWFGLAIAMRGQQVSDFPLCNKSFNLSYCGHDL